MYLWGYKHTSQSLRQAVKLFTQFQHFMKLFVFLCEPLDNFSVLISLLAGLSNNFR
jgi:hypothetical protein